MKTKQRVTSFLWSHSNWSLQRWCKSMCLEALREYVGVFFFLFFFTFFSRFLFCSFSFSNLKQHLHCVECETILKGVCSRATCFHLELAEVWPYFDMHSLPLCASLRGECQYPWWNAHKAADVHRHFAEQPFFCYQVIPTILCHISVFRKCALNSQI